MKLVRNKDISTKRFKQYKQSAEVKKILLEGGIVCKNISLCKLMNNNFVRKVVSNKVDYDRGEKVLSGQYNWLKKAKIDGMNVPKVKKYEKNIKETFFDMEYLENTELLIKICSKKQ